MFTKTLLQTQFMGFKFKGTMTKWPVHVHKQTQHETRKTTGRNIHL